MQLGSQNAFKAVCHCCGLELKLELFCNQCQSQKNLVPYEFGICMAQAVLK